MHQTAYAALFKKLNKVASADKKRSTSEKKTKSGRKGCDEPRGASHRRAERGADRDRETRR